MAILKEFCCAAHGDFDAYVETSSDPDSTDPLAPCPHGCGSGMVQRVFRTPPAFQSSHYNGTNRTIEALMREQGITDVNQRGGDGMRMTDWRASKRMSEAMAMMGHGANADVDMNRYFAPVGAAGEHLGRTPPALVKQNGVTVVADTGVALNRPIAIPAAPAFDGSGLGTPAGDA